MVGDGVVRVADASAAAVEHLLQRREPVGEVRVGVQVAPELLQVHEVGQLARERGLDLAAILAQRRRDERQAESLVDLLLGLGREQVARLRPRRGRTR